MKNTIEFKNEKFIVTKDEDGFKRIINISDETIYFIEESEKTVLESVDEDGNFLEGYFLYKEVSKEIHDNANTWYKFFLLPHTETKLMNYEFVES